MSAKTFVRVPEFLPANRLSSFERAMLVRQQRYETPQGHEGSYSQHGVRGPWLKDVEAEVYIDGHSLADLTEVFTTTATNLGVSGPKSLVLDFRQEPVAYEDYDRHTVYLRGQREATADEVATLLDYQKWEMTQRKHMDEVNKQEFIRRAKTMGLTADDLA